MDTNIPYKSFCWSLGTTSFRTKNFNKTIEEQLSLLNEFWGRNENKTESWNGNDIIQTRYYNFMKEKGFIVGEARNKPKDAREKTSGLVDIGLIDDGRRLTQVGNNLLQISESNDFESDNFFQIPKDSYIYLKQLLKSYNKVDEDTVKPMIVLLYVLSKVTYLTLDEFTYLLPLCTNENDTDEIISGIMSMRDGNATIDDIIISRLMKMTNYKVALKMLCMPTTVDELLLCTVGLNRKSRDYDKTYFKLYQSLRLAYLGKHDDLMPNVYDDIRKIKIDRYWIKYMFDTVSRKAIERNPAKHTNKTLFNDVSTEEEFRTAFFKVMHLLKAKATLHDYLDLNRRYIRTTDIVLFEDNIVKLDIVPKHFFNSIIDKLYGEAYTSSNILTEDVPMNQIAECLVIDEKAVIEGVNLDLGTNVTTIDEAHVALENNRYERLQHLIDTKFSDSQLLTLLNCFETRNDTDIRNMVTNDADVPTIFEYVLGILWYKASERKGKILDYMNLSLDADLLPKTHAAGGEADIVYAYEETDSYPKHTLLLEATLADGTNQRRMEMEPVSRHLGQHLIRTGNMNSYCLFATNFLNINVISDFRARKYTPYYDSQNYSKCVNGMKIIPLQTSELKKIVTNGRIYKELYPLFEEAFDSSLPPHEWYDKCINQRT